jgi:thymidylate synthase (FAD)
MRIVNPSVEMWHDNNNWMAHVARCARICYASDKGEDKNLVNRLLKDKHHSMFRHRSHYFIIPETDSICQSIKLSLNECPYVEFDTDTKNLYFATNGHYILNNEEFYDIIKKYEVDTIQFENTPVGYNLMRFTFKVVTQVSTSRELNRVSPNNIAEQSTRYVNFVKKELLGAICTPHWMIPLMGIYPEYDIKNKDDIKLFSEGDRGTEVYLKACQNNFEAYNELITECDAIPQDARGVLPLDTLTVCAYTYSISEWRAIIDLRYYGTTGKPHPNAKLIAGMIRDKLIDCGYEFR